MKVACIGDPHFRVENVLEIEEFTQKLYKLLEIEQPDFIVVLGDLLHTHERLFTIALNKAYEFIKSLRNIAKTFVLVGNHDYIQNQQFLTENHWMNAMKEWENVVVVDKVVEYQNFFFCPYVPPGRFEEALATFPVPGMWKKATCIFAHQEFYGCKMGAIISVEGDKWDESYPLVVSGHIHSKQKLQQNMYYTGSAMQHAFGESEENTIAIFQFPEGNLKEVDLQLKRKKIVYVNMDKIDDFQASEKAKDNIKLTLVGNYDEFKAFKKGSKYKELISKNIKVVFKVEKKKEEKEEKIEFVHEDVSFPKILRQLVYKSEDAEQIRFFELLVENNDVLIL